MLWRLSPELRRHFGWNEGQRWIKRYGVEQRVYKQTLQPGETIGAVSKRREESKTKELPGVSPMVLRHVLPSALFLELADVVKDLPPYSEQVVSVPLGPVLGPVYEKLERESTLAIRQLLARGDNSALSSWFHGLMTYPNLPWEGATIVHPRRNEVLGEAPPLSEEVIYPKERALLERIRQERSEGRRVLVYVEHTNKHDLLPRLKRLIEEDDRRWRIGLPVEGLERDSSTTSPRHPGGLEAVRVKVLRSTTVSAARREAWLEQTVAEGCDVLICHSGLVEVGLDLLAFPTICCYEVIFSTTRLRQASRRSYRPGQQLPVRVFWFNYEQAMEARGLLLIARKITASLMVEGKLPGGESMATQVLGKGGGNPLLELAQSVIEDAEGAKRVVAGSLEAALREMQEAEQQQDELIGGESVKEALAAQSASSTGQAEDEIVKEAMDVEMMLKVPHPPQHPQEVLLSLPETTGEQGTNHAADVPDKAPTLLVHRPTSTVQPTLPPDSLHPMARQRDEKAELPVLGATLWDALLPQQAALFASEEISPSDVQSTRNPLAGDVRTQEASVSKLSPMDKPPEVHPRPSYHQDQDGPQAETTTDSAPDQRIIAALQYLSGVCDGARALDGHGFNKQDASFGHSLAAQSLKKPLSQKQLEQGFKLLGKYQGQLREAGLTLPTHKEVERWFAQMASAEEATIGEGAISIEGEHLLVRFPRFDPHKVQRIKAIRARFGGPGFDAASKAWVLPLHAAETLLRTFPTLEGSATVEQHLAPQAQQPTDQQSSLEKRLSEITAIYQQLYERQPDERLMRQRVQTFAEADHWLTEFKHRLAIKQQARWDQPRGNADSA